MKRKKGQQIEMFAAPSPEAVKTAPVVRDLTPQAEKLLANFVVFSNAEGGVKRLRELVLELAIAGKLTETQPDDGDAGTLLTALCRANRDQISDIDVSDAPYSVPPTWRWVRMADLGKFVGGGTPSKSNTEFWTGNIPWVSPKDMKRPYIADAEDHISEAAVRESTVKLIDPGALLFVVRGMILAHSFPTAITQSVVTINQDMKALVLTMPSIGEYLLRACQAYRRRILQRIERSSHGTCRLDSDQLAQVPIPLPPLAEQKRIVAKVDELMKLCDELEARQAKQRETGARLTKSALDALATAEGPEELAVAWERVVGNFEGLVSRADDVKKVRETVLDLAVTGKLNQEDPMDAPLEEHHGPNARVQHLSRARTSRTEPLPPVDQSQLPYTPAHWRWIRLGDIAEVVGGIAKGKDFKDIQTESYPYLRVANVQRGYVDLKHIKYIELPSTDLAKYELAIGDILFTEGGDWDKLGRSAVWAGQISPCIHQNHVFRARPSVSIVNSRWISMCSNSALGRRYFENASKQTTNLASINMTQLRSWPVPIPPLPEQKRIVAKVDQLMALSDELETKLRQSEETARKVAEALVAELLQG